MWENLTSTAQLLLLINIKGSYVYKLMKKKYLQLMPSSYTEYTAEYAVDNAI